MLVNPHSWDQLGKEEGDRSDVDEPHMILCELFLCSSAVEGSWVSLCSQQWMHTIVGQAKTWEKPFLCFKHGCRQSPDLRVSSGWGVTSPAWEGPGGVMGLGYRQNSEGTPQGPLVCVGDLQVWCMGVWWSH